MYNIVGLHKERLGASLGMTLEKRNEIINFIGWREINNTDTGNWCSSAGITGGNSRIRRKQSRNYIYLQDFKYKLIVTFNLIEDLRTICTLLYLVLWQILFVCLYINYRYDVTKYLLQFNWALSRYMSNRNRHAILYTSHTLMYLRPP
jgi:hypothetical protein